ncbi:MAG: hypothetical protein ABJA93_13895 [Sporichthyaceae bacterium]
MRAKGTGQWSRQGDGRIDASVFGKLVWMVPASLRRTPPRTRDRRDGLQIQVGAGECEEFSAARRAWFADLYEQSADFTALMQRFDPDGVLRNDLLAEDFPWTR